MRQQNRQGATPKAVLRRIGDAAAEALLNDNRSRRGQRHTASSLGAALLLGAVAACRSLRAIETITAKLHVSVRRRTGIRGRISDTTLNRTVADIDRSDARNALIRYIKAEHRRGTLEPTRLPFRFVAIDGKGYGALRGGDVPSDANDRNNDVQYVQPEDGDDYGLLRGHGAWLISSRATVCIDQRPVPGATNEIGAMPAFLAGLFTAYSKTRIIDAVTTDAGNASLRVAGLCREHGKHYFLAIKEPQGGIHAYAVQQLGRRTQSADFELVLRERGRWICYRVWVHETPDGYLDWRHARQLVRLQRTVTTIGDDGEVEDETVGNRFFVTSYVRAELRAEHCYTVARHHWRCENCGHWTADAVWKEDARRMPWARKNPDAIYVAVVLRAIGLSIVAVLRAMTRREYTPREPPPWAEVIDDVKVALRAPLTRHELDVV